MDIDKIWQSIILIKIKRHDSDCFTSREIKALAEVYHMEMKPFCKDVLKLSDQQFYTAKREGSNSVRCMEYRRKKQEFFETNAHSYRFKMMKEKIKQDASKNFNIKELKEFSSKLGINLNDLCIHILGISREMLNGLKNGTYKTVSSQKYQEEKEKYFESIQESMMAYLLEFRKGSDSSHRFSYEELEFYTSEFGINMRDFLGRILGNVEYIKRNRSFERGHIYQSDQYKKFKEKNMQEIGDQILENLVIKRMRITGSSRFDKEELEQISKDYQINVRDLMVYVLGKSDQLYHDLKADRIQTCNSQRYREKKEEFIVSKRENFMSEINPNIKTYYSFEELEKLSSNLGISTYDLVVNVMKKSRSNFYRISQNYKNGKRVSIGENKSGPLPSNYCKNNVNDLLEIAKIAVRSAIGYMEANGYSCKRYYFDLLQEGYLYMVSKGNPIDENGIFIIASDAYEERHGAILYKKVYFNALDNIKHFCSKEYTGEVYDVMIQTKGTTDEISEEDEDTSLFINGLSEDEHEREILEFFSENLLNDQTMQEACKKFQVSSEDIQGVFTKVREKIIKKELGIEYEWNR